MMLEPKRPSRGLDRNPRNPRSLFGLEQALKAQEKTYDAGFVRNSLTPTGRALSATVDDLV